MMNLTFDISELKYFSHTKRNAAEQKIKEELNGKPDNPEIHNRLGLILFDRKDYPSAIESFKKAIDLDKKYIEPY